MCDLPASAQAVTVYDGGTGTKTGRCLRRMPMPVHKAVPGRIPVLSIGRLNPRLRQGFVDQSLVARDILLGAARHTIRFVQQDVGFSVTRTPADRIWPEASLDRMVDLILRYKGDVFIVLSNLNSAGPTGTYSNGVALAEVAAKFKAVAKRRSRNLNDTELSNLLCEHLHLAALRFGPDDTWPDGKPFGMHTKFWMVDDRLFYIGSENLYPTELQEFGYVVEDINAATTTYYDFWQPLWTWS